MIHRFLLSGSGFGKKELLQIASYYRNYLQSDILKNWADKTADSAYGGYLTCFDRKWNITGYDKGAWGQARHIFTFSEAYRLFGKEKKWLYLAKTGIDFIKNRMYDGNGRLYYLVDRSGMQIKEKTISIFSDAFFILGLSHYIFVTDTTAELDLLKTVYAKFEENITNENFKDITPYMYEKSVLHHAVFMIALNAVTTASTVLGTEHCSSLIHYCLDKILNLFLDKERNCIVEKKMTDGTFCTGHNSRLVNVGHTYECLWFILDAAKTLKNADLLKTVCSIANSTEEHIKQTSKPLIFSFALDGKAEKNTTWKYEATFSPFDNVSWTYAESLCLFGYLAALTKNDTYILRFKHIHNLVQNHFVDTEYGDWFHALDENFKVIKNFKGSVVKTAFHIPRALMKLITVFESTDLNTIFF